MRLTSKLVAAVGLSTVLAATAACSGAGGAGRWRRWWRR